MNHEIYLTKRRRRSALESGFKQMWLDKFDEAWKFAEAYKKEHGLSRWKQEHRDYVEHCRKHYRKYLFSNPIKNSFEKYDRYCNYMSKNY